MHDEMDQGLPHDLRTLLQKRPNRRKMLGFLALAGIVGCGDNAEESSTSGGGAGSTSADTTSSTGATSTSSTSSGGGSCDKVPEETEGPYPGDGSNGKNVLTMSGIVRSDITTSLDGGATAEGVPLTVKLTLVTADGSCAPLVGYAIYLWHCDVDGNYSMYSAAVTDETYLRGVQETDSEGTVTFQTIFPGCYDGRWPHMHFEVYPSLAEATDSKNKLATSQLAMPEATRDEVYATSGYEASVTNLGKISLATDNVFSDGATQQIPSISGAVGNGLSASLVFGIQV